jgi:hypothetical protein
MNNVFLLLLAYQPPLEAFIAFFAKLALFFCNGEALGFERTLLAYAPVDIPAFFAELLNAPFVPLRFILAEAAPSQFLFCELVLREATITTLAISTI